MITLPEKAVKTERLKFVPSDQGNILEIYPFYDEKKQKLLFIWLIAFGIGGLAIISQLMTPASSELKIMIMVFAFFWAYFFYKVLKAYRWRKSGKERLIFGENKLYYGRIIGERGIMHAYDRELLGDLKKVDISEKNFFAAMGDSYWVISGEKLAFSHAGQQIPFGLRLTKGEVHLITKRTAAYFGGKQTT